MSSKGVSSDRWQSNQSHLGILDDDDDDHDDCHTTTMAWPSSIDGSAAIASFWRQTHFREGRARTRTAMQCIHDCGVELT
mmetsp:Transcript_8762/g.18445  ORF Transcript_8762/g.18445 Transcript_8762/m.18445 type:complete len:80 (-) Transcript_8762:20-259(-)